VNACWLGVRSSRTRRVGVPRLAVDHCFDARIVAGLVRRTPDLDIVSIRDVGLAAASDQRVLESAAQDGRVILTHDRATLVGFTYERVARGELMCGVIAVAGQCPIGRAVEDLLLLFECTDDDAWDGRLYFVPI
jgi:hypothetical protein